MENEGRVPTSCRFLLAVQGNDESSGSCGWWILV